MISRVEMPMWVISEVSQLARSLPGIFMDLKWMKDTNKT